MHPVHMHAGLKLDKITETQDEDMRTFDNVKSVIIKQH